MAPDTPSRRPRRVRVGAVCTAVVVTTVAASSCSVTIGETPGDAAEDVIVGELAAQLGVEFTEPSCSEPDEDEPGQRFSCTAELGAATAEFDAVVEEDDEFFIAATNVIGTDDLALVEEEAAAVLGPEVGVEIDPDDVECPDTPTVLDGDVLRCEITDASNGEVFELTVTFGPYVLREGFGERNYLVGDPVG